MAPQYLMKESLTYLNVVQIPALESDIRSQHVKSLCERASCEFCACYYGTLSRAQSSRALAFTAVEISHSYPDLRLITTVVPCPVLRVWAPAHLNSFEKIQK